MMRGTLQSAIVTGGANGLGALIVRALHSAGFRVAIADLDLASASNLARALDPSGASAFGLHVDVRQRTDLERARDEIVKRWGSAEVLVNDAVLQRTTPLFDIDDDEFDDVMAVNVRGTFVASQVFGQLFKANRYGRIINLASLAGQNGALQRGRITRPPRERS